MSTGWSVSVAELPTCYDKKDGHLTSPPSGGLGGAFGGEAWQTPYFPQRQRVSKCVQPLPRWRGLGGGYPPLWRGLGGGQWMEVAHSF